METKKHKSFFLKCLSAFLFLLTAFFIHSCKKENSKSSPKLDTALEQAKSWYNTTYPVKVSDSASLKTQSTDGTFDFSQRFKPDWQHSHKFKSGNKGVIELPIDPGSKLNIDLHDKATGKVPYDKNNSRSYFLLFNDGKKYTAYIETVIADASYLKGDTSKLKNNTFYHSDDDFTGLVLYFTPKGKYVQGYGYRNGQLLRPGGTEASAGKVTQSIGESKLAPQDMVTICIDWYYQTYTDGVLTSERYLYTTCDTYNSDDGGSSGGTTPPDPDCGPPPIAEDAISGKKINSTIHVNFIPPPDDPCDQDPSHTKMEDFGEDDPSECLNCRIAPENWQDFLDYLSANNYTVSTATKMRVAIDGIDYIGNVTSVYNSSGQLVSSYFTPAQDQGNLYSGVQYTFGNKGPNGNQNQATSPPAIFGSPSETFGNSTITYQPVTTGTTGNTATIDYEGNPYMSDTDPDIAWWNDNTTTFQHQNLPTWANMFANYPKNAQSDDLPGPKVYQLVGGAVLSAYNSDPIHYQNACALRISRALNYSGVNIPVVSGQTYKGADNKNYFLSSAKLYNFMKKTFGAGSIVLNQADGGAHGYNFDLHLRGHKGIYIMEAASPKLFGALGHATLYIGYDCIGGHTYYDAPGGVTKITLWILN